MSTTIKVPSDAWSLPSPPCYMEGAPSAEDAERELREAAAARAVWKPSRKARALVRRLRAKAVSRVIVVQVIDAIMFWIPEEGPYPMRAVCCDVVIRRDSEGHERAYLLLERVEVIKTPEGYDGRANHLESVDGGRFLLSLDRFRELSVEDEP
jgi:hypothetical protein